MCTVCNKSSGLKNRAQSLVKKVFGRPKVSQVCDHSQSDLEELKAVATETIDIIVINSAINTLSSNCKLYENAIKELKSKLLS